MGGSRKAAKATSIRTRSAPVSNAVLQAQQGLGVSARLKAQQTVREDPRITTAKANQEAAARTAAQQAAASRDTANKLIAQGRSPTDKAVRNALAQAVTSERAAKQISELPLSTNRQGIPTVAQTASQILAQSNLEAARSRARRSSGAGVTSSQEAASELFATGGQVAQTPGQQKAAESFATQQARTKTAQVRKSSQFSEQAQSTIRQQEKPKVVGLTVVQPKPKKVSTRVITSQQQTVTRDRPISIIPEAFAEESPRQVQKAPLTAIQRQEFSPLDLVTGFGTSSSLIDTPAVKVQAQNIDVAPNIFDPNVSQQTGIETQQDKVQSVRDQGLAISPIGPDGKVTIVRTSGKVQKVSPQVAQEFASQGRIATGFDVTTTVKSTEGRPQEFDLSAKPLVAPTRDQFADTGKAKSKEQLREETLAFRAGQAPNVTLFDIALDRRSRGEIFGPGESISRGGEEISGTELAAVQRIREEQDIARIANALQSQKFQAITSGKSGTQVLQQIQDVESRGEQQIIEPQFTFGTQQAASDVPFFEDRERIGGVQSPEQLALIQERLDTTPRPSLQETLGFGIPTTTVETVFTPREPIAPVTTGTEDKLKKLGFTPTASKIESGIIPKSEGALVSVPTPNETYNADVLGSVNNQFGGFDFLQAKTQQNLAVQGLTKKPQEAGEGGFNQEQFNFLTQKLTPQQARDFQFTKEDSLVTQDIGSLIGQRQLGISLGDIGTNIFVGGVLGPVNAVSGLSKGLGGPDFLGPVRNQLGDLGTTFAADIENEVIAIQNLPNIPGAVSDVARGRVGGNQPFLEFNPTPQDLLIGGLLESGVSSAVARPIVSTPNAQGLVQAQLKDGTVIETSVQNAQRLADTGKLKTFGGGGAEQFKTEQSQLFENLGVLAQERPLAFVGSGLEFAGATVVGAKALSLTAKGLKTGLQAARGSRGARTVVRTAEESPAFPTGATASDIAPTSDVISGGAFGRSFKDLFKTTKKPSDSLTETRINELVKEVQERTLRETGKKITKEQARSTVISVANRKRPFSELGTLSDQDIRTQERLFRQTQSGLPVESDLPLLQQTIQTSKEFASKQRGGLREIGPGKIQGAEERLFQDVQASKIFRSNLQKAIDKAKRDGAEAASGKKAPPPEPPKTVNALIKQYSQANNVTLRVAEKQLKSSGAIQKGARGTDKLGDTAKQASNDIRVINDVKRGRISLDEGRDILQATERQIPKASGEPTSLLTQEGKLKTFDNIFADVLGPTGKVKQVPTKIIRRGDDFVRVPTRQGLDDLGKITNVDDLFTRSSQLGKGVDDLSSLTSTARRSLSSATRQVFEETGEGTGKKGSSGGTILKRPKVKPPKEEPSIRPRASDDFGGGVGKLPKAIDDFQAPKLKNDLFGVITPKFLSRIDDDVIQQSRDDFGQRTGEIADDRLILGGLERQSALELFGQPQRQSGRLRQPQPQRQQLQPFQSEFFGFGQFQDQQQRARGGRVRFGGLFLGPGASDSSGDARDSARRFFRVFDVGRDKSGNPIPFGQVSRGLGVQVQAAAPIFEVEDVIGRRKSKRPRQEEFFDIGF